MKNKYEKRTNTDTATMDRKKNQETLQRFEFGIWKRESFAKAFGAIKYHQTALIKLRKCQTN